MIKHPKLMEICREQKIALEVCPISFVISFTYSHTTNPTEKHMFIGTRYWYDLPSSFNLLDTALIVSTAPFSSVIQPLYLCTLSRRY